METISLNTRLQRIKAGLCSSPEHILPGLMEFADLPVNAVIGRIFPDLQIKFNNYVSAMYKKPSSGFTYGDLAVIVTDDYLRNGARRDRTADSLILFYFTCLEADCLIREKCRDRVSRDRYLEEFALTDLKGIADVTIGEYLDSVLRLPMDNLMAQRLFAFRMEKAGVMPMTVSAVYLCLLDHARDHERSYEDPVNARFPAHSLCIRERMIELFAVPVAYAAVERSKAQEQEIK